MRYDQGQYNSDRDRWGGETPPIQVASYVFVDKRFRAAVSEPPADALTSNTYDVV